MLAPYLSHEPTARRLGAAYLLNDQTYALSVARWAAGGGDPEGRLPFYLGASGVLWLAWQVSTVVGVLVGAAVPEDVPLDFSVPLVFLVLLVPLLVTRPAVVAAAVGGVAAVAGAEMGAGPLSIIVGAASGIAAGAVAEALTEQRRRSSSP